LDEQAHHCDVLNAFKVNTEAVDLAGIEGKKMFLPGEVSKVTCNYMEKSAEVVVASHLIGW